MDVDHGNLDDICCTSLYWGVDGVPLGESPDGSVVRIDIRQISAAFEYGFYVSLTLGYLDVLLHVVFYLWICLEITVDEFFCLFTVSLQSFGKSENSDAVDNAEVGALGFSALVVRHLFYIFFVNFGSCCCMDVMPFVEGFNHIVITAQMCHHS